MRIYVYENEEFDGTATDITEGVQTLYDCVVQSLDWGSGFISLEDALPIAALAKACGFEGIEECERYVAEAEKQERRSQLRKHGYSWEESYELAKDPNLTADALKKPPPDPPSVSVPVHPAMASVGQTGIVAGTRNPYVERITIDSDADDITDEVELKPGQLERSIEELEEAESKREER